jgi:hypothetical protein
VIEGFHATVFAYGQTGSGKTHTMEGFGDAASGKAPTRLGRSKSSECTGRFVKAIARVGWSQARIVHAGFAGCKKKTRSVALLVKQQLSLTMAVETSKLGFQARMLQKQSSRQWSVIRNTKKEWLAWVIKNLLLGTKLRACEV